jgi:hypothetical protein
MKSILSTILACVLVNGVPRTNAETQSSAELLTKVQQGDRKAILEAGKTGDKIFIPILEKMAKPPRFVYQIDPEMAKRLGPQVVEETQKSQAHPVYDEPSAVSARMALVKLGVKEYVDEILTEATSPTNSPVYKDLGQYPQYFQRKSDAIKIQMLAFDKLVYLKDRSTVHVLAALLYARENPQDYIVGGDVIFDLPSSMTMQTLAQIVDNPPKIDLPPVSETHDARIKIWQQWWEQNKDKYP